MSCIPNLAGHLLLCSPNNCWQGGFQCLPVETSLSSRRTFWTRQGPHAGFLSCVVHSGPWEHSGTFVQINPLPPTPVSVSFHPEGLRSFQVSWRAAFYGNSLAHPFPNSPLRPALLWHSPSLWLEELQGPYWVAAVASLGLL
jgi:hypothetical protein